ncbi:MAG: lamin tail domain-containing protein [Patescibacteria group bacterium]|jgi:hypothetical protein
MKKIGGIVVSICLLLAIFQPMVSIAEEEIPPIVINEVAWAGSTVSIADEWIELKNTTDEEIDLIDWEIRRLDANGQQKVAMVTINIGQNHLIPASGYFLIANNGKDYQFGGGPSVLNIDPDYIDTAVSILDNPFKLFLYDQSDQIIDTAGDGQSSGVNFCGIKGVTMERNIAYGPGGEKTNWHEATAAINLDTDRPDLGTPLAENSLPAPATPVISKIIPDQAETETIWEIEEIIGENFITTGVTQIKLEKDDLSIWATNVNVLTSTTIDTAKFNLSSAEAGEWDVIVINPDGQTAILSNAVTITEPEEEPEIPIYSDKITLSELYPHPPSGNEEFIELYNSGDNSANLKGWKLDDQSPGGSAVYTISSDLIISPHQYLTFPKSQTHLALNDTGDQARLLQPNDVIVEVTPNYGTATEGNSYSKINGNWQWTQRVTPNAANLYESTDEDEEDVILDNTNNDPTSLQPNEVVIKLKANSITATSAMLTWEINLPGAIGDIEIYQSEKSGQLGLQIGQTTSSATTYPVKNLVSKTKYFFTVVGSYNADDVKSNQIELTVASPGRTSNSGTSGLLKQIIITEILPNPNAGDNEFIELYNPGDQTVDITGWQLLDASGKVYIINALDSVEIAATEEVDEPTAVVLEPQQYLLLAYSTTHIRLNNSGGEELQLLDSQDNLIDELDYDGSVKQGYAYVLAPNERWFWSNETTPGAVNDISFASGNETDNFNLVDTGELWRWGTFFWMSGLLSAIMWTYRKRYGYPNLHHQ